MTALSCPLHCKEDASLAVSPKNYDRFDPAPVFPLLQLLPRQNGLWHEQQCEMRGAAFCSEWL